MTKREYLREIIFDTLRDVDWIAEELISGNERYKYMEFFFHALLERVRHGEEMLASASEVKEECLRRGIPWYITQYGQYFFVDGISFVYEGDCIGMSADPFMECPGFCMENGCGITSEEVVRIAKDCRIMFGMLPGCVAEYFHELTCMQR